MNNDNRTTASYYPSLMFSVPVQVMGLDTIKASHDLGTVSDDLYQHFVDYEYLKSIMDEEKLKVSLAATSCLLLTGTCKPQGERVVGMLPSLKVYIHVGEGTDNKWSVHFLSNVLVIDDLPVPLHVSLETLQVYPENQRGRHLATSFPIQYQSHPYWEERRRHLLAFEKLSINARSLGN